MYPLRIFMVCLFLLVLPLSALSGPMEIPSGAKCHVCGMKVDAKSLFAVQIVEDGKLLSFCDIGDMLSHYKKVKTKPASIYVRDYNTGEWIDALKASYVKGSEFSTPMGWGIAAFGEKEEALKAGAAMNFDGALKMLKGGMKMKMDMDMKMDTDMDMDMKMDMH